MDESKNKVLKRKKLNIFQRFGNRISKYFNRSKASNTSIDETGSIERSCVEDISNKSKSHEDLRVKNKFRKNKKTCGKFLNIPKKNDRCLSEGDLRREDGQFDSQESSPKTKDFNTNHSVTKTSNVSNTYKDDLTFKNELALKLRTKNPSRDNVSEHSKTPDSPTGTQSGSTPPRHHQFTEARTPQSMSSLSHSSNSLLSGNVATNYGTSDGESMSRSVIDSNDDSGIVVDLATPMCKTTNGALLDFSAARQKIAASKARRVRPKGLAKDSGDVILSSDCERFSPVRDKRDILEEISEEDCSLSPSSLSITKQHKVDEISKIDLDKDRKSISSKLIIQDHVPLTHKIVSIKLDSSINDLPLIQSCQLGQLSKSDIKPDIDSGKAIFSLRKSKFAFDSGERISDKIESTPKFNVKLRSTGSITQVPSTDKRRDEKIGSDLLVNDRTKSSGIKDEECEPGPPKINRYSSLRTFTDTKIAIKPQCAPTTNQESVTTSNVAIDFENKRASRVLTMVKNFESVPSRDSN